MALQRIKSSWIALTITSWAHYRRFTKLGHEKRNIVFYAESNQDWHHLAPYINYLTHDLNRQVCYVTSDLLDPGLKQNNKHLISFYVKEGFWQILFFQMLKADVMVLTMIDLHTMQLKRSINRVHYIYLFHAMGSTHMVDFANSYDHYDSIFCVGPHQMKEIKKREEIYNLPQKYLFKHGYARLDLLRTAYASYTPKTNTSGKFQVLLAPTWGEHSILHLCGEPLILHLLQAQFHVTLRPHYQTVKLAPSLINSLCQKFSKYENFTYLSSMGDNESLFQSDILICDWSSTSIEYALALEKPVLYIDVPRRVRNPDYQKLDLEPMEVTIRNQVGAVLSLDNIEQAPSLINKLLANPQQFKKKMTALRKRIVFNLDQSIKAGAEEIARIADEQVHTRRTEKTCCNQNK